MNIKEIRATTGLSQQRFGDWLGIPKRTLQNWEMEVATPPDYLVKLIEYYVKHEYMSYKNKG